MWYFSRSRAIEKNPNHSFYGKVVLTSHETSADSEAVNQFEDGNLQEINPNVDFARPTLRRRHDPTSDPCDAQLKRQKTEEEEMDENTRKSDRRG
ncbi:hypothetical protein B9Z55_027169 [Caenorhabditis nigoni]|uniref:Uncharacterized protein n=1 Tax=Caenorhabditis nigoni TaxID=1611254 RepID=A0A2G5SGI6_9PELO|nr:hypothetical protein B9Z55_027169 [Caenorhabditis nigoni]